MGFVRGKRTELKIIDDSFDNWCVEHEEEINEILQPFLKHLMRSKNLKISLFICRLKEK